MPTIVAVYTAQALVEPLKQIVAELLPDVRLINIADDSLIQDVIRAGKVPKAVARRLLQYYHIGAEIGADVILNTCSSVGEVVDLGRQVIETPILKIDAPMAQQAVTRFERIAVLATLPTTLAPTVRLLEAEAAAAGKDVTIVEGLAEGAFEALTDGDPDAHDRLLLETARRVAQNADGLVLAQGSMARMKDELAQQTGKPVLASPRSGVQAVKAFLNNVPTV